MTRVEKASAINLVLLGGGLTMIGATLSLAEHNRYVTCERDHPADPAACRTGSAGGSGGHGGGGFGGYSSGEAGIARGGFGGFGGSHGGGDGGGGE